MPSVGNVTVGGKVTAAKENEQTGFINAEGSILVVPTSVSSTGGSASSSVTALGKVTFTTAVTVSINGCFTALYDNYVIVFNIPTIATVANLEVRLRVAGTDLATSTYLYGGTSNNGVGAATGSNGTTTAFYLTRNPTGALAASGSFRLFNPFVTAAKRLSAQAGTINATYVTGDNVGGSQPSTVAHDGFTLMNDGGVAMTGTLQVFGTNTL